MKMNLKTMRLLPKSIIACLVAVAALVSCSTATDLNDYINGSQGSPYDPAKKVTVTDFIPRKGGVGQQVVISGTNFGNDTSIVNVNIGGKKAVVVNAKDDKIYCFVPSHAFGTKVTVTVGDNEQGLTEQTASADDEFFYERKMVVGTLCGYKDDDDRQGWKTGSFKDVAGFRNDGVMQFSPYNHQQLFVVYDQEPYHGTVAHSIQLIDLDKKTVEDILPLSMFNNERLRTIDFTVDPYAYREDGSFDMTDWDDETETASYLATEEWERNATPDQLKWREHLIVTVDKENSTYTAPAIYIVDRDENGEFSGSSPHRVLAAYNQCNGAAVHPVNGEIYFNSYTKGEMLRLDMDKYWATIDPNYIEDPESEPWDPNAKDNLISSSDGSQAFEVLFKIQDNAFECQIDIHPSGKYAYIVVINHEYILKTDYNFETKRFSAPYLVAGVMNSKGNDDGVGKSAKLARPYQGTFAPNDDYIKEGREDIYDFFFCDSGNLDENNKNDVAKFGSTIRCLSPEGIVSTYAGGGANTHSDGNVWGNENGELRDVARFYRPTGLVSDLTYDILDADGKPTRIFYILDTMNRQIRTIGYEHPEEEDAPETEE